MFSFFKKKEYKLTPIQELLLALLRAQLWLKPVDEIVLPSTPEEWDELINLGYKQTVICFIAKACLRHPKVDEIPTDIRDEFEAVLEENAKIHECHNAILIELFTKFEEQGLHPILLKGQGIAQMYPEPELRQCGDIDLYFSPEEYEKAKVFIFTLDINAKQEKETYKHYGTSYKGIDVELHRHICNFPNPFVNKKFQEWTLEEMKSPSSVVIAGNDVSVSSPIYGLISSFAHMWHHFENEDASLRQLCDIEMMYEYWKKNADLSLLEGKLNKFDLLRYWCIIICLWDKFLQDSLTGNKIRYAKQAYLILSFIFLNGGFRHGRSCVNHKNMMIEKIKIRYNRVLGRYIKYYPILGIQLFWRYAVREKVKPYLWLRTIIDSGFGFRK